MNIRYQYPIFNIAVMTDKPPTILCSITNLCHLLSRHDHLGMKLQCLMSLSGQVNIRLLSQYPYIQLLIKVALDIWHFCGEKITKIYSSNHHIFLKISLVIKFWTGKFVMLLIFTPVHNLFYWCRMMSSWRQSCENRNGACIVSLNSL